ncbi:group II intron reverse transcriptase/maturase [Solimonas sp. SE-A11]|uniref:group II intron reverse transcriptase/maturase n=1 Tax=Solimonas sp. SE-A11 TaxID=3054954 RepID=UPI00259C9432|nr:group II intron reverse transcriptase/maturase [Solimonas sp. SE-A11]MDM4772971.1 group II intron reverse transcriptase/maturase [Solimonas sp. SE-A11]
MDAQAVLPRDVASDVWQDWTSLDWAGIHQTVRRLQTRIAKAIREGDWRGAKRLQKLLTRTTSAKALAVRRVTENQGRRTPGVDGETWSAPDSKWKAVQSLHTTGYKPKPLRRVHIPKANGEKRPLGIPTMKDRAMQALFLLALDPIAESTADENSYGFRPFRSTADAIVQCKNLLARGHSSKWVLEADIKGCFDNISHDWLLQHIPTDRKVLQRWLKAGVVEMGRLSPTEAGTPQGGIISPVLANMTLDGLESLLAERFKSRKHKVHMVRYADDFVVTGSSKELLEAQVKPVIEEFLAERGLWLSPTKTKITHISDGFDFLGWNVRWVRNGLQVKPSKKNRLAHYDKLRQQIHELRTAKQENVILTLNPIIRGWARYHIPVAVAATFKKMDHLLWGKLWAWAKRRHPSKGKRWIKKRYFRREGARDWVFAVDGMRLLRYSDFHFREHLKIKADANPYDPKWDAYFDECLTRLMMATLTGRKKLAWLWREQGGKCSVCGQPITKQTRWHVHHRVRRSDGGSDKLTNLQLLHPTCHRQIHSQPTGSPRRNGSPEAG